MADILGYLIEISDRTEINGGFGLLRNYKKAITSPDKLAELLGKESGHIVLSARLIDIPEYKKSNKKTEELL